MPSSEWAFIRRILGWIGAAFALVFIVVVISETADVVRLAQGIHPVLGQVVLWTLLTLYAVFIAVPTVMVLRLPKAVPLPDPVDDAAVALYRDHLRRVLAPAAASRAISVDTDEGLAELIAALDAEATAVVLESARAVFASTAVSQSGRLDALVVLSAQTRMIWRIAHIYRQRPGVRDLWQLYVNVLTTSLAAVQMEDLDVEQQLEPALSIIIGSAGRGDPRREGGGGTDHRIAAERRGQRLPDAPRGRCGQALLRRGHGSGAARSAPVGDARGGEHARERGQRGRSTGEADRGSIGQGLLESHQGRGNGRMERADGAVRRVAGRAGSGRGGVGEHRSELEIGGRSLSARTVARQRETRRIGVPRMW